MREIHKTFKIYNFNELNKEVQEKVENDFIIMIIEELFEVYSEKELKEQGYTYNKNYIESTPAFAYQKFYDDNKKLIDKEVNERLKDYEFFKNGQIAAIEEEI